MYLESKKIYITKKQIWFWGILATTIAFFLWLTGAVHATVFESLATSEVDSITSGVSGVANEVFSADYYSKIAADGSILSVIIDGLKGFGIGFAIVISMYKMITEIQKAQDPVDCLLRSFFELCVVIAIIANLDAIINSIDSIGKVVLELVSSAPKSDSYTKPTASSLREKLGYKDSMWGWLQMSMALIIPYAFAWIQGILARVISYSVIIELGIRRAFMPFAVADIGAEGIRSKGFRYLKLYLSVYFQQAIILAACLILSALTTAVMSSMASEGGMNTIINILALNLAGCFVMFKSTSWASDVVGA